MSGVSRLAEEPTQRPGTLHCHGRSEPAVPGEEEEQVGLNRNEQSNIVIIKTVESHGGVREYCVVFLEDECGDPSSDTEGS